MRTALLLGFFAFFAAAISGCDQSNAPQGASSTTAPGTADSGTPAAVPQSKSLAELRLGYFPNITHAQAVLGVASGDFQTAIGSVKLTPRTFNAGPDLITALNAGAIDIGYVGPGPAINAFSQSHGASIRVISGAAANGVVIVARKDSGITSLKDLAGKKIATPQLWNTQDIAAKHYMISVLGQKDASNVKPIANSSQSGAMREGAIDAAWVPEPWGARLIAETGATLIAEEKDLWPGKEFSLTVIITTPQFLADHADVVEKILQVHHQWTVRLSQHPEQYQQQLNDELAKLAGKPLPVDILQAAISRTEFTDDALPDTFAAMSQWAYDLEVVKSKPDLTGLFATDLIKKIVGSGSTTKP
jgi:NitT/TauT family transport system substrate-binding protein